MKRTFTLLSMLAFAASVFAQAPTTGAADPTADQGDVISLFSGVYTDVTVDTWKTDWSVSDFADTTIDGNEMKRYTNLGYAGIETVGANLVDASGMTHLNLDFWSPNSTQFKIKLVDFGADGAYQGGDDSEHELTFNAPGQNEWVNFKIPLTDFAGLTGTAHIAQYLIVSEPYQTSTVFIDNVYFSKGASEKVPTMGATAPTEAAGDVISMFCDEYTDVTVDTWRTSWSSANLEDDTIDGNPVKKYSALDVVGVETTGANLIDASEMDFFNLDVWSPNFTTFKIKLVDFGADGAFDGGDDTEHELTFDMPDQETWIKYKIPMSDFTGLGSSAHMAQFLFVGAPSGASTVYIDNVYFSKESTTSSAAASLNGINMYPNPAKSVLNIDLQKATSEISTLEIRDLQGRVVMTQNIYNDLQHSVDISLICSGIYVAILKGPEANFTQKIIIE